MSTTVFPQTGDPDYGELFALLLGQANTTDFVGRGLGITVDTTNNTATIASGTCYIHIQSASVPNTTKTVEDLGYAVQIDSQTIDLPYTGTNYIAVVPDYSQLDTVSVTAYDLESNVPSTGLLIGSADPADGSTTLLNRDPDVTAENLTVVGEATIDADLSVTGSVTIDGTLSADDGTTVIDASNNVPISALAANSVTIETTGDLTGGGTVALGESVTLGTDVPITSVFGRTGDISASSGDYTHAQIGAVGNDDHHAWPVPNSGLVNNSITVNANGDLSGGGGVSLGDSISLSVTTTDRYTDTEAVTAVDGEVALAATSVGGLDSAVDSNNTDISSLQSNKLDASNYNPETDTHSRYTDAEAISAVGGEIDAAATSVSALDTQVNTNVSDIGALQADKLDQSSYTPEIDTHSRYTDSEAISAADGQVSVAAASVSGLDNQVSTNVSDISTAQSNISSLQSNKLDASNYTPVTAVNNEASLTVDITGDADTVDGYDLVKDGSDDLGTINLETVSSTSSLAYTDTDAIAALDGEVSAAASTVTGLDSQVSTNTSNISSLQSNKLDSTSYTPIADIDGEVSAAASTVTGLDSQVSTNTSNISSLQSNKLDSTSYTPIADIDGEVDAAATSVATLDDQVSTNVTDISNLQSNKLDASNYTPENDISSVTATTELTLPDKSPGDTAPSSTSIAIDTTTGRLLIAKDTS